MREKREKHVADNNKTKEGEATKVKGGEGWDEKNRDKRRNNDCL
jgi:hypothetical protein